MNYDLSNPLQAESFKKRCNVLFKKKSVVSLVEKKPQRSLSQNAYLHAALGYFGLQFGYKIEEVKILYFKKVCNPELFVKKIKDIITGQEVEVLRSSADLSVDEMTLAIERFRNWSSDVAGVYIPSPEEHRMIMEMERQVEIAKLYL